MRRRHSPLLLMVPLPCSRIVCGHLVEQAGYDYSQLFANSRPTARPSAVERAKSILLRTGVGFSDPDAVLYAEALRWMDEVEPHLTAISHYQLCKQAASLFEQRKLRPGIWTEDALKG